MHMVLTVLAMIALLYMLFCMVKIVQVSLKKQKWNRWFAQSMIALTAFFLLGSLSSHTGDNNTASASADDTSTASASVADDDPCDHTGPGETKQQCEDNAIEINKNAEANLKANGLYKDVNP